MKKVIIPSIFCFIAFQTSYAQSGGQDILNQLIKIGNQAIGGSGTTVKTPNGGTINIPKIPGTSTTNSSRPTDQMMASGLKEALEVGFVNAAGKLSLTDGFFKNLAIKILFPPEAQKVEKTLRSLGFNKQCDDAIMSLNRAAESASKEAKPIFVSAIKQMTIADAVNILLGSQDAATQYLRKTSGVQLEQKFQPVIKTNLDKVNATKYWNTVMTTYNRVPTVQKVNPNLEQYVTQKAVDGLFKTIAVEEKKIREQPLARTSQILKDVFGWAATQKK